MPKKYEYRRRRTFTRTNSASTRITANGAPPARRIRPNITENNRRNGTRILRNHEFVAFRTRPHGASAREWGIFEIRKSNYVVLTTEFGCGRGEMPKKYEYRRRRTFTRTNSASTRITANGAPPARRIRPNITENNRRNGTRIRRDRESGAFRPHSRHIRVRMRYFRNL